MFAKKLADMVKSNGNKLTTGFVGTPYLLHVLSDNGYSELAYTLLLQTEYPSWLYPITKGATTIWEHWDGVKPDGSFWSSDMNSFNHYAYGAVGDWMYGAAAGIRTDETAPGFRHAVIKPAVTERLDHLEASIETRFGTLSSGWRRAGGRVSYTVVVPPGCTATVILGEAVHEVGSGEFHWEM